MNGASSVVRLTDLVLRFVDDVHPPVLDGKMNDLGARMEVELLRSTRLVGLDGLYADGRAPGDLLIGVA